MLSTVLSTCNFENLVVVSERASRRYTWVLTRRPGAGAGGAPPGDAVEEWVAGRDSRI